MSTYPVWGWGGPSDEPRTADLLAAGPATAEHLGFAVQPPEVPAPLRPLPPARAALPAAMARLGSADPLDRARHGLGRSYRDLVRGIRGQPDHVPDLVVRPETEQHIADLLDWAGGAGVAMVPFGGGTSVVGGVEPDLGPDQRPVVSLDLGRLSGVVEVDPVSRAARVRAGTLGPDLEAGLKPHGLTARFYPQSFERSTLGGWVATRAAGHFSVGPTHIDDMVESVRAVTPAGVWESRRLPGSGAGPSPDRMLLGSEGTLAVITEAWLRVQPRPAARAATSIAFPDWAAGCEAVRAVVQAGWQPAAARLLDGVEAATTGVLATGESVLVLALESLAAPVQADLDAILGLCADHGGRVLEPPGTPGRGGSGGSASWRSSFLRAPYQREHLVLLGVLVETLETATTWDQLPALCDAVRAAITDALTRVCGAGQVSIRLTHAYRDGAAPYVTVLAPARRGSELAQWAEVKAAATEAILAAGGTVTHHHAVGRDHGPGYREQRPDPFAAALAGAKHALDPHALLNPGVLLPAGERR